MNLFLCMLPLKILNLHKLLKLYNNLNFFFSLQRLAEYMEYAHLLTKGKVMIY